MCDWSMVEGGSQAASPGDTPEKDGDRATSLPLASSLRTSASRTRPTSEPAPPIPLVWQNGDSRCLRWKRSEVTGYEWHPPGSIGRTSGQEPGPTVEPLQNPLSKLPKRSSIKQQNWLLWFANKPKEQEVRSPVQSGGSTNNQKNWSSCFGRVASIKCVLVRKSTVRH